MSPIVELAVEGVTDIPVANQLVVYCGGEPGPPREMTGAPNLQRSLAGYNSAARFGPWLVLHDLDRAECPIALSRALIPDPAPFMCLRIPVRAVEAWYLADVDAIADFLDVSAAIVPRDPEALARPKRSIVDLARRSGKREVVRSLVPREGSGREVGPGYAGAMTLFGRDVWKVDRAIASGRAASLEKAANRLRSILDGFRGQTR